MSNEILAPVVLDAARCLDCGHCLDACPTDVFARDLTSGRVVALYAGDCHVCFLCVSDCPSGAITVSWDTPNPRQRCVYDHLGLDLSEFGAAASEVSSEVIDDGQ